MTRLGLVAMALLAAFIMGCAREDVTADQPGNEPVATVETPPEPAVEPVGEAVEWKVVSGPDDAVVKIDCYYPMNEGHAWVKELNQRIVDAYPGKVQITHIDWFTEEGQPIAEAAGVIGCSAYVLDGEMIVSKSQAIGGWTEEGLLERIGEAVTAAEGGTAAGDATEPTEPAAEPTEGGSETE